MGDAALSALHDHARKNRVSLMQAARDLSATDEMKPKPRGALRDLVAAFARWNALAATARHTELAETVLEESGYTGMWQAERTVEAAGRLENLKELVRSMDEFDSLAGFLEHVSLVMDADKAEDQDAVSIMTLHAAKGLEFDTVFLPGWEEGLFPHQRALDESGRAGLEEERRLAYVGLTRAKKRAHVHFAQNRRIHGSWNSSLPSRFLDELPESAVEVREAPSAFTWGAQHSYSGSRFEGRHDPFTGTYQTPGWQRAQANRMKVQDGRANRGPTTIEGELVAKSTSQTPSSYAVGTRVFHIKFGYGDVAEVEGNKLTVDFDKAGRKRVLDGFVEKA